MKGKEADSKYPYDYASAFIQTISPWDENGYCMESSQAIYIRKMIAMVLDVDDEELAEKLADAYLKYEFKTQMFKTNFKKIEFPEKSIGCKVINDGDVKFAYWLEPKE